MAKETEALANTDTSISTDKVTTATDMSTTSIKPVRSDDEKSLEADDFFQGDGVSDKKVSGIPESTPPLRIHATRVPERLSGRLSGSLSTLQIPPNLNHQFLRRKSDPAVMSSRSGSRSPGNQNYDGGSSISSLEDAGIDTDILTDKMGFLELDLKEQQDSSQALNRSFSNLGIVSERMSEATLEDCHAFSDVKAREGRDSRGNSITTGGDVSSNVLEPLDEGEDEEEDDDEGEEKVKITNMEDILESPEEEAAEQTPSSLPKS
jgi:hypothetical protein